MESNILKPIRFVDFSHRNKVVELYKAGDPPGSQYMRESCALTLLPSSDISIRNILNSTDPFFICTRGYRRCTGNTVATMWIRTVRCRQVPWRRRLIPSLQCKHEHSFLSREVPTHTVVDHADHTHCTLSVHPRDNEPPITTCTVLPFSLFLSRPLSLFLRLSRRDRSRGISRVCM